MVSPSAKRRFLFPTGEGETARAFTIFALLAVLLVGLGWTSKTVLLRDVGQIVRGEHLVAATQDARSIAEAVSSLGRGPTGLDFHRLRTRRVQVEGFLTQRLAERPDLRFVEVRDRFGARVAAVPATLITNVAGIPRAQWTIMQGGIPVGDVRVGLSTDAIERDIGRDHRSLGFKIAIAVGLGIGLLAVGFFYSLRLIRQNRELEHARQSAARVAYRVNLGSGLAHEIRNPLNSMNMNLQMLAEELQGVPELEGGEHLEMLRSMQGEIKRIATLIDVFLQYARPATPQLEVKDLNEVLNATARFLQADFRQSGVELVLDLEPLLPSVELDEAQLRQALLNILGNARQVMQPGGHVRVTSRAGMGGEAVIEIADTGPGIAPDSIEKVFEPFFSKRAGGTGLGLAIARQMVENHGGKIEVDSQLGEGTTFRIRLPRRHARAGVPPGAKTSR
jgi:signal transduction histidine kinase